MIITCPSCHKKFKLDATLIPAEGRKLQCGFCDHKWHYKLDNTNLENDDKKNVVKIKTDELSKNEIPSEVERIIIESFALNVSNTNIKAAKEINATIKIFK